MKKIQIEKTIAFLLVLFVVFCIVSNIMIPKGITGTPVTTIIDEMYGQEKDTVDVFILGSSQTVYGISAMRMLDEYGISAYSASTGEQTVACSYFLLKEFCKKQNPSILIYDTSMLFEPQREKRARTVLDNTPMSINKLEAIYEVRKEGIKDSTWTYLFPILRYHSRWNEIEETDFVYKGKNKETFKGNIMRSEADTTMTYERICTDIDEIDDAITMEENVERLFREMIVYCEKNGIQLVLIKTPKEDWNKKKMQQVQKIADEYGIPFLDFNTSEMIQKTGIVIEEDMWDKEHLNIRGVKKMTDYISEYLLEHYEFADGRQTKAYDEQQAKRFRVDWEDKYVRSSYDLQELSELLQNERYEIWLQTSEPVNETMDLPMQETLEKIGLDINLMEIQGMNVVGQYSQNQVVEEHVLQDNVSFTGVSANGVFYEWDGANAKITVGEQEINFQMRGINIVVYDNQNANVVDTFTIYYDGEQGKNMIYRVTQ